MENQAVLDANISSHAQAPPSSGEDEVLRRQMALRRVFETQADFLLGVLRSYAARFGVATGHEVGEVALDVFSELFAEAMRTAAKFDPDRPGAAWLLGIAFNLMLRKREARFKENARAGRESPLNNAGGAGGADESGESEIEMFDRLAYAAGHHGLWTPPPAWEAAQGVEELLALVGSEDREVLRLAVIHRLSGEALAQHWNVLPATARQRVSRAVKRLSQAYHQRAA